MVCCLFSKHQPSTLKAGKTNTFPAVRAKSKIKKIKRTAILL